MSDTAPIILAVIGTGVTLLGILAGLLLSLFRILNAKIDALDNRIDSLKEKTTARIDALRQELRTDIAALHSRIDALDQALFNHKAPAA